KLMYKAFTATTTYTPTVNQRIVWGIVVGGGRNGGGSSNYDGPSGAGGGGGWVAIIHDAWLKKGITYNISIGGGGDGTSSIEVHLAAHADKVTIPSTVGSRLSNGGASVTTNVGNAGSRPVLALASPVIIGAGGAQRGGVHGSSYAAQAGGGGGIQLRSVLFGVSNPTAGQGSDLSYSDTRAYGGAGGVGFGAGGGGSGAINKNGVYGGGGVGAPGAVALILENYPGGAL
ncbi:hypothetical protein LJB93_03580, partial [Desulfovibrio sp. OttesenSCG-928-F07]|nr:hypothetical protein [Desulfovibrio sp. OttesenSCG-928-F07]